jgi:hypothetical protein
MNVRFALLTCVLSFCLPQVLLVLVLLLGSSAHR